MCPGFDRDSGMSQLACNLLESVRRLERVTTAQRAEYGPVIWSTSQSWKWAVEA